MEDKRFEKVVDELRHVVRLATYVANDRSPWGDAKWNTPFLRCFVYFGESVEPPRFDAFWWPEELHLTLGDKASRLQLVN